MLERARRADVTLRPHLKTAKSARVAQMATSAAFRGITVSTLAEAEYFLAHGFSDITYAVCMIPGRVSRVCELAQRGAQLTLITDHPATAKAIAASARERDTPLRMLIELDCGEHRTGVSGDGPELLAIAQVIADASHLELAGVLTHGGHSYGCTSAEQVTEVAEQERLTVVAAAERLREHGHRCDTVSAGSTPTAVLGSSFSGLTEIRPGVYMFFDLAQYSLGVCDWRDIAISVLATVISHQPAHNRLIIDAGGMALSKDTSAGTRLENVGYGWLVDDTMKHRIGDAWVATADQEHGYVVGTGLPFEQLAIGSRVRVLPNHACMTAAAHSRYVVVDGADDRVVDVWERHNGW